MIKRNDVIKRVWSEQTQTQVDPNAAKIAEQLKVVNSNLTNITNMVNNNAKTLGIESVTNINKLIAGLAAQVQNIQKNSMTQQSNQAAQKQQQTNQQNQQTNPQNQQTQR